MTTIQLFDAQGHAQAVLSEKLTFRPAVYGIFIEQNQILLLRDTETELLRPPGRIVAANEAPSQALRHFFRKLADITPLLGALLFMETQYRQENGRFYQLSALYYAVERPFIATLAFNPEADQPEWFPLRTLQRTQFQFGYEAVQAGKLSLQR